MRYKNCYVLWLNYFNKGLTRREGRKLPLNKAIKDPTLNELINIVKYLGYNIIEYREARYPSSWWIKSGYVIVDKSSVRDVDGKMKLINKIAKEWRRRRGG